MNVRLKNEDEGVETVRGLMHNLNYTKFFSSPIDIYINDELYKATIEFWPITDDSQQVIKVVTKIKVLYINEEKYFTPQFRDLTNIRIGAKDYYINIGKVTKIDKYLEGIEITFIEF